MNQPLRTCLSCRRSFWSGGTRTEENYCPACQQEEGLPGESVPVMLSGSTAVRDTLRFVALSALPPENRRPVGKGGGRPGSRKQRRAETVGAQPVESEVSDDSGEAMAPPAVRSLPLSTYRQLGFNCPSCYTVLVIKDPENYDGRAAPCPYCAVNIMPPRIAPSSPFTLVSSPVHTPAALPGRSRSREEAMDDGSASRHPTAVEAELA